MKSPSRLGFTLIELLTVIAIIAILASMVFVAGPRILERVKIASWSNTCNQIRTSCVGYFTKYKDTYPPGYGYKVLGGPVQGLDIQRFHLTPYLARLDFFGKTDVYDTFSQGGDTDKDGLISLLEFSPVGVKDRFDPTKYIFPKVLYRMTNLNVAVDPDPTIAQGRTMGDEVNDQLAAKPRPMIYIPVLRDDAMKAVKYWKLVAGTPQLGGPQVGWYAERWRPSDVFPNNVKNPLPQLLRTPSKFDDFILISVGPGNSTGGIVTPRPNSQFVADVRAQANYNDDDFYYYLALRAYFLATRDANDNRLWDFDLRNRTRKAEAKALAPAGLNLLPDGTDGYGPLIYLPNENGV